MGPIPLDPVTDECRFGTLWWSFNELKDSDCYVIESSVLWVREVPSHRFFRIADGYVPEMVDKSVLDSDRCLSNILYTTAFAAYGID